MSVAYSTPRGAARPLPLTPVISALCLIFTALVLARVGLNAIILDLVINYTRDDGMIFEKIHPANYGFVALTLFALTFYRIELSAYETAVLRAMLVLLMAVVVLIGFAGLRGNGGSAGFLIDSYAGACFAALLFLFPAEIRRGMGTSLLIGTLISALIAVAEFVSRTRLLPFTETETAFRPLGLTSHPLDLGLRCATAIPFMAATRLSRSWKAILSLGFLLGLVVSGARTALVGGAVCAVILAVGAVGATATAPRRLQRRIVAVIAALLMLPAAVAVLYAAGVLNRFQAGVDDSNAQARVVVYQVFDNMSWSDVLFGVGMPEIKRIALDNLHLVAVESPYVIFTGVFGAILTVVFALVLVGVVIVMLRGALPATVIATVLFFVLSGSNNGLATKGSAIFTLFFFIIAFRPDPDEASPLIEPPEGEPPPEGAIPWTPPGPALDDVPLRTRDERRRV